jgi:hypothetical protein
LYRLIYIIPAFIIAGIGFGSFHPVAFALLAMVPAYLFSKQLERKKNGHNNKGDDQ